MYLLLTFFAFLLVFVLTEVCTKWLQLNSDLTRKIAHIISGIITFFTPFYLTKWEIFSIGIIFFFLLILTKRFKLIPSIHSVQRKTLGEMYFPLAIAISALLFLPFDVIAFQFGILILGISDAVAALVGLRFGKHSYKILGNKKSLEGSLAFFITSCLIMLGLIGNFNYNFLFIVFLLTFVEFALVFGLDNLILPVLAGYLFTLLK